MKTGKETKKGKKTKLTMTVGQISEESGGAAQQQQLTVGFQALHTFKQT